MSLGDTIVRWPAWIHASLDKYLKDTVTTVAVYAETDEVPVPPPQVRMEFNWIGPKIFQPTKNSYVLSINLVVLVTTIPDNVHAFRAYDSQGTCLLGVPTCIPVYRYGGQIGDDDTQLGILVRQDPITEYMVGHQDATNRIRQVGITANYRMTL